MKEVYFTETDQPRIDDCRLSELEDLARASIRGRARLCLHQTHEDILQEMIIALCTGAYIPPHRQFGKTKSYVVLKGSIGVGFFSPEGEIEEFLTMSPLGQNATSVIRFPTERWHTVVSISEIAIYIEVVSGPYDSAETEIAPWAPNEAEGALADSFVRRLQAYK